MTFYADIKPLEVRALEGECPTAVMKVIARERGRLRGIPNIYKLSLRLRDAFIEQDVRRTTLHLEFAGFISSNVETGTGELKNLNLTDAGWEASGAKKPFWMGGEA